MKAFRAYWTDEAEVTAPLHAVSRVSPPRPRWGRLYIALGTVGLIGTAARFTVTSPLMLEVADVAFTGLLFATLVGWVHVNRVALTRMGEPDSGTGRPRMRIVKSRGRGAKEAFADDRIVRLDPDDRVILPYDFR